MNFTAGVNTEGIYGKEILDEGTSPILYELKELAINLNETASNLFLVGNDFQKSTIPWKRNNSLSTLTKG